ncbi:MAG: shikimate kinase [Thermoleophilia bacterium]|nr:shikimate kinase [Thermoleophilia bacterium]
MAPSLILIGFMGSGKTAVGKRVARELGWKFIDTDAVVEQKKGKSISEIFAAEGETGFRRAEAAAVLSLLEEAATACGGEVISLGGGAVTIPEVLKRLRDEPLVVFLDQDVEEAFARSQDGRRPLALNRERFGELYAERENFYRTASGYAVDVRGRTVAEIAREIAGIIRERKTGL